MEAKRTFKNILFDLGGVLMNLDYALTTAAFQRVAPAFDSFDPVYSGNVHKSLFEDFEKGKLRAGEFRTGVRKILDQELGDEAIDLAWNAMILDLPYRRLEMLKSLKNKHRLFLLSNTNEIHIKAVSDILQKAYGFSDLSAFFEKEYYSHKLGIRKPDKEIFQFVLDENGLIPSETLFIDDSPQHVESASSLGLGTYLLKKGEEVERVVLSVEC
jgi:HAD superfamily hydrolase (TIGR01509 family)